jgi:hypothetical protein
MKLFHATYIPLFCLSLIGCAGSGSNPSGVSWLDLLGNLTNSEIIARLDSPTASIITSFDPTGGNDDYNHFVRKGPAGWVVLADLKGPGYVSRFWTTGADDGKHRVRFFFDGEREPRLDLSLDELTGGREPFQPPLAAYENYCWYSFIPMPYAKRLVIMMQEGGQREGGWPRLFYQVNYCNLPKGKPVKTFTGEVTPADASKLAVVADYWKKGGLAEVPAGSKQLSESLSLAPGARQALQDLAGPAIVRELTVTPDFSKLPTAVDRERILRDVVLHITWNGASLPSVAAPLGDFFGSFWRRTRCQSMYFGMTGNTFVCRFPMPFQSSARISFENQGQQSVDLALHVSCQALPSWDENWGYFHSSWSRSTPSDVGKPHAILRTTGKGRYVGCILSVVSMDRSWWILEGDEMMYRDGKTSPDWHGTGLEDYFNGAWYYRNVLIRPLYGLTVKTFFRISQYRLHLLDPVAYDSSFNMVFERGPNHASHGFMESVAYYYQDKPGAAMNTLGAAADRETPRDPLAEATIMTDLANYERIGDYQGAREYIDEFLETHREFPFRSVLRLRQIAYNERINGFGATRPEYERFLAAETNTVALDQAKLLMWFHESASNALCSLYANMRARAMLDGKELCAVEKPDRIVVVGLSIGPGKHAMAAQAGWQSYPSWVQISLRTHGADVNSGPDWKCKFNASGDWGSTEFDDAAWPSAGGLGTKGPPEEPYIWVEPNAFVDMHSKATGLRPRDEDWPSRQSFMVYRHAFELPADR